MYATPVRVKRSANDSVTSVSREDAVNVYKRRMQDMLNSAKRDPSAGGNSARGQSPVLKTNQTKINITNVVNQSREIPISKIKLLDGQKVCLKNQQKENNPNRKSLNEFEKKRNSTPRIKVATPRTNL